MAEVKTGFKVGDLVMVRPFQEDWVGQEPGFANNMRQYCGMSFKIHCIYGNTNIELDIAHGSGYQWHEDWLAPLKKVAKVKEIDKKDLEKLPPLERGYVENFIPHVRMRWEADITNKEAVHKKMEAEYKHTGDELDVLKKRFGGVKKNDLKQMVHSFKEDEDRYKLAERYFEVIEFRKDHLYLVTKDVVLNWKGRMNDYEVHMGKYAINAYYTGVVKAVGCGHNPPMIEGRISHPHIKEGNPCFGNVAGDIARALSDGSWATFMEMVGLWVRSYYPGGWYTSLGKFIPIEQPCSRCNQGDAMCTCANTNCSGCGLAEADCTCLRCAIHDFTLVGAHPDSHCKGDATGSCRFYDKKANACVHKDWIKKMEERKNAGKAKKPERGLKVITF